MLGRDFSPVLIVVLSGDLFFYGLISLFDVIKTVL